MQVSPVAQAIPQPPQLALSEMLSTQVPLQQMPPGPAAAQAVPFGNTAQVG